MASFNCFLEQVIKPKLARPGRVHVTTCAWDRDGKRIAGGIGDGSIQVMIPKACSDLLITFCQGKFVFNTLSLSIR